MFACRCPCVFDIFYDVYIVYTYMCLVIYTYIQYMLFRSEKCKHLNRSKKCVKHVVYLFPQNVTVYASPYKFHFAYVPILWKGRMTCGGLARFVPAPATTIFFGSSSACPLAASVREGVYVRMFFPCNCDLSKMPGIFSLACARRRFALRELVPF